MAGRVTRDHHNLRRNLKLNDNYISNDGGDEGISIADDGKVTCNFDGTIEYSHSTDNEPSIKIFRNNARYSGSIIRLAGSPAPSHMFTKQTLGTLNFTREQLGNQTGARLVVKTDDVPNTQLSNALQFDGSTTYIDLGDNTFTNHTGNYGANITIHARIYVDALPGSGEINTIIGKYETNLHEWQLYIDENGAVTFNVQQSSTGNVAGYKATTPNSVITTGKWYTILANLSWYDGGTTMAGRPVVVVAYDDSGLKYHVGVSSSALSGYMQNTAAKVYIGKGKDSGDYFQGKIMEVGTWGSTFEHSSETYTTTTSALTSTSSLHLLEYAKTFYNTGLRNNRLSMAEGYYSGGALTTGGQMQTVMTGYWPLNETSGNIAYDQVDIEFAATILHPGVIYGGTWVDSGLALEGSRKYLSTSNYPCSLSFQTTRENSTKPIERLRITSSGEAAFQNLNSSALLFSDNTKYLDAGYIDKLSNSTTFTINVWANLSLSANHVIWKMQDDNVSEYIYLQVTTSGKLELYWVNTSDSAVGTSGGQAVNTYVKKDTGNNHLIAANTWHQITVVYNGSLTATSQTELFRLKMYIDGQHVTDLAGETTSTGGTGTADTITWNDKGSATPAVNESIPLKTPYLNGGKFFLGDDGTNSIVGTLGESSVWTIALTDAQVNTLYNEGSPYDASTMEKDALIAYWKMEEITSANKVVNSIKSGTYDLTAVNSPIVSVLHQLPAKTLQVAADNVQTFRNPFYMQNNYISDNVGSSIVSSNADGNGGMYISPDGNVSLMDESTCIEVQDPIGKDDSDTYLTVTGVTELNQADNWTVSIWAYPTAIGTHMGLWRMSHGDGLSGTENVFISLRYHSNTFEVQFWDESSGSAVQQGLHTPSGTLELNKWSHFVVTYDRSQFDNGAADNGTSNMCKLYKDGVQITFTLAGTTSDGIVGSLLNSALTLSGTNPPSFWIGNNGGGGFQGKIGETALWTRTLTSAEVIKLYDNGHPFPPNAILDPDTNLLGYWKMSPQQDTDKDGAWDDETTPAKDTWFTTPVTASGGFNHANGWGYGGNHHKVINEVSEGTYDAYIKHYNASYNYRIVSGLPAANAQMTNDGFSVLRGGFKNYLLNQTSGFFVPPTGNTILGTFNATQKGVTPTGVTSNNTGISAVVDSSTPTIVGTVNNIGAEITVTGGTSGTQNNTALSLKATGADTNTHIKCLYDDTNYMTIATGANGATTLSTVDSNGASADFILNADGDIDLITANGDIVFDNSIDRLATINNEGLSIEKGGIKIGAPTAAYYNPEGAGEESNLITTETAIQLQGPHPLLWIETENDTGLTNGLYEDPIIRLGAKGNYGQSDDYDKYGQIRYDRNSKTLILENGATEGTANISFRTYSSDWTWNTNHPYIESFRVNGYGMFATNPDAGNITNNPEATMHLRLAKNTDVDGVHLRLTAHSDDSTYTDLKVDKNGDTRMISKGDIYLQASGGEIIFADGEHDTADVIAYIDHEGFHVDQNFVPTSTVAGDNFMLQQSGGLLSSATPAEVVTKLGVIPTSDLLDEDNMTTDSATKPASQQSIKAYVGSQVGSLASTVAGKLALSGGTMTGSVDFGDNDITNIDSLDADKFSIAGGTEMTGIGAAVSGNSSTNIPTANRVKEYVDSNCFHFIRVGAYINTSSNSFLFIAGGESQRDNTSITGNSENMVFTAPYDGSLVKVMARSEADCGSSDFNFYLRTSETGYETPSTLSPTSSITVDMGVDDTSYEFDFSSVTNSFSKGDIMSFSFDPTNVPYDSHFVIVLKFDTST